MIFSESNANIWLLSGGVQAVHSYHYLIQESHKWWKNTASAHFVAMESWLEQAQHTQMRCNLRRLLFGWGKSNGRCHLNKVVWRWYLVELSSQSSMFAKHCYRTQMGAALCIYRSHHNIMMCNLRTGFQKFLGFCWLIMGCDYIYPPPLPLTEQPVPG